MSIYINEGEFWETERIKTIFSTENRMLCMCKIEAAIAAAEADMGIVSPRDAKKIAEMVGSENVDVDIFNEQLESTGGHPVVSFISAWKKSFGDDSAKNMIHFAAATPDIIDNVKILQLKDVHEIIKGDLAALRDVLRELAREHRGTVMVGRSHHQHAVPMTFGYKVATWLMEVQRQLVRLEESASRLFMVSCFGAVGTVGTFGDRGMEWNRLVGEHLGLGWSPVSWQTSRDTELEYLCDLCSIAGTVGRIGLELYELSRTEISEVAEPWTHGNMGSSTMPHKRNPWGLEMMVSLARTCTAQIGNEFNCMSQFHERDFMVQYQENFSIPVICNTCGQLLQYALRIVGGLEVYPERMKKNLDLTNGAIMLENVMMLLTKKMDRFTAHAKLYEYAMQAHGGDTLIIEMLRKDEEIMAILSPEELEEAFDYAGYIGNCHAQVDEALRLCI